MRLVSQSHNGDCCELVNVLRRTQVLRVLSLLPIALVPAADIYVASAPDWRSGLSLSEVPRVLWHGAIMLVLAAGVMTRRLGVQVVCTLLMLGGVILGAASIGLLYVPALVASVIATVIQMEMGGD